MVYLSLVLVLAAAVVSVGCGLAGPSKAAATSSSGSDPLNASPSSINFGNVPVGSSSTQKIALSDSGTASITISQITVFGGVFTVNGLTPPMNLAAGQSASLNVVYAPTAAGAQSGGVTVVSNASNSPTLIQLGGTGVAPQLSVVPSSVSFGTVTVGLTNTQTVTVTNSGNASLTISQATVTGAGFSLSGLTLPLNLVAGQSSSFTVAFAPAVAEAVSGNISLASNAPGSPTNIPLSGTGQASVPQLTANPASLSFGSVAVGSSSTQTATITNTGNANVTISQVSVGGGVFTVSGLTPPLTLTPGQFASLNVTFTPNTTGGMSGGVTVTSNASNSPTVVSLSGSSHSVALSWTASTSTVVGYYVYRGTQSGGPYSTELNSTPVAATTYTDNTVQAGQTYYYVVTAVDSSNVQSNPSNEASASIPTP